MAVDSLHRALELYGAPLYVFHEIVHNRHVVENFRAKGVVFVDSVEEVPMGATLMFSAHGVSPAIRELSAKKGLRSIDATCPLVTKVHLEAIRFAQAGYTIVLIGHRGHDEVLGTMGEAPQVIHLVENVAEVEALDFSPGTKLAFLTQTTLSVDDARTIIEALRRKFPRIEGPKKDDICYATQNRQEAVRILASEAEVVLVLGSQNSSNSQRLAELGKLSGREAYLIDRPEEIQASWLEGKKTVLVTAGASAPEAVVQSCLQYLQSKYGAEVEQRHIREEKVVFGLPKELRASSLSL